MNLGIPAAGPLAGSLALLGSLRASGRRRVVENIPTSKTTGVYIGLVELKGNAECSEPLLGFLSQVSCVYYRWSVEEHWSRTVVETTTDAQGKATVRTRHESGWTSVEGDEARVPFYLRDEEGAVLIRPEGAEIEPESVFSHDCTPTDPLYYEKGPASAVPDSDNRRRFSEAVIRVGCPLYIIGQSREREDLVAPEVAADPDAPLFLISTRTEEKVSSRLAVSTWGFGVVGLVCTVAGLVIRDYALQRSLDWGSRSHVIVGSGYCLAYLLGWSWMAYNSLANLYQRVRQAWSLVEVQIKRRADLIPSLVATVKGFRDYGKELQEHLSLLRGQMEATPPGVQGPDYQACAGVISGIAEAYPDLRSQESFLRLQKELVAAEERIALARGYFNEIATHYNTRLQVLPEALVAGLGGFSPVELMKAGGFERAAVPVA